MRPNPSYAGWRLAGGIMGKKNDKYEPLNVLGAQYEALKQLFKEKISQFGGANRAKELISKVA